MKPTFRPYQSEDDFWRLREFLREVYLLNDRHEWSWHVSRLEYSRWHVLANCAHLKLEDVAFICELEGRIIGLLMPDGGKGEAHFSVHPAFDTLELEEQALDVAEAHLAADQPDGKRQLYIWSPEHNTLRQNLLTQRGYRRDNWPEHQWRRPLDRPIPDVPVAPGYTIRSLGDGLELLERCYASGLGFHKGDIKIAVENRSDVTWYRNIQTAPLYRRDLDIVAVAPDGAIAAFCTIWFDDVARVAYFEPVATIPDHQRRGLGKAVMTEGLRRLKRMGCILAGVGGYSEHANALYRSVMGPECELYVPWVQEW